MALREIIKRNILNNEDSIILKNREILNVHDNNITVNTDKLKLTNSTNSLTVTSSDRFTGDHAISLINVTTTDCMTAGPAAEATFTGGSIISNFRVITQNGDGLSLGTDRITVNRSGVYQIIQSFLVHTGNAGSNGDTRIMVNGIDYAAGYAHGADTGNWEKSVGALVMYINAGDYIQVKAQSDLYIWGSASGYTHSPFTVVRIGD